MIFSETGTVSQMSVRCAVVLSRRAVPLVPTTVWGRSAGRLPIRSDRVPNKPPVSRRNRRHGSCGKWAAKVSRTLHDRSTGPLERGGCPRHRCPLNNQRPDTLIVFTSPFGRSAEHDLMPGDQTGNDHGCRGRYGADPYRYGGLDFRRFALTLIHEPQLQLR